MDLSDSEITGVDSEGVPAHAGGVDLSRDGGDVYCATAVPAHAGGVDLSWDNLMNNLEITVPAHAGGVDLSIRAPSQFGRAPSPPMRAGWI